MYYHQLVHEIKTKYVENLVTFSVYFGGNT
jgi:hypothetical protein